jgi:CRP/FNR family transcriptional regulator, cyclic AMP receptor protein
MTARYAQYLAHLPLFAALTPQHLQVVAESFTLRMYQPGEVIARQGDRAGGIVMIVGGTVNLIQAGPAGEPQLVGRMAAGEYFNQSALLGDLQEAATVLAVDQVTIMFLPRDTFATMLSHHPEIRERLPIRVDQATIHHTKKLFRGQRDDEVVIDQFRRHWWAFLRFFWIPLVAIMLAVALAIAIESPVVRVLLLPFGILAALGFAVYVVLEWRNDSIILTDKRVIRLSATIVTLRQSISEMALAAVQEVNFFYPAADPLARVFNYGNLEIKTAGSAGDLHLSLVPNPRALQQMILATRRVIRSDDQSWQQSKMRADIDRWINPGQAPMTQPQVPYAPLGEPPAAPAPFPVRVRAPLALRIELPDGGLRLRHHWGVWLRALLLPMMLLIGVLVVASLNVGGVFGAASGVVWALTALAGVISMIWAYLVDWDWRHDYYEINDNYVIMVHRRPLFLQDDHDQVLLRQIDNVISESSGLAAQLLGYGDVHISLIGADDHKILKNVAQPIAVQGEISRRQARVAAAQEMERNRAQEQAIGQYIALYHEMARETGAPTMPLSGGVMAGGYTAGTTMVDPGYPNPGTQVPPHQSTPAPAPVRPARPPGARPGPYVSPGQPYEPPEYGPETRPAGNRPPNIPR